MSMDRKQISAELIDVAQQVKAGNLTREDAQIGLLTLLVSLLCDIKDELGEIKEHTEQIVDHTYIIRVNQPDSRLPRF